MPAPVVKRGQTATKTLTSTLQTMYYDLKSLPTYTVAQLPAPATAPRGLVLVSNGAAGQPCVAYNNGTAYKVVGTLGATVSAS
jgi:hypothetical protein